MTARLVATLSSLANNEAHHPKHYDVESSPIHIQDMATMDKLRSQLFTICYFKWVIIEALVK